MSHRDYSTALSLAQVHMMHWPPLLWYKWFKIFLHTVWVLKRQQILVTIRKCTLTTRHHENKLRNTNLGAFLTHSL